jgi:transposase
VSKTCPAYAPEYRRRIIELALAGRSPEDLAKEFEPSAPTIRTWVNQHRADAGERPGLKFPPELGQRMLTLRG